MWYNNFRDGGKIMTAEMKEMIRLVESALNEIEEKEQNKSVE